MQIHDIKRILEQQRDTATMAINAINTLSEHIQKQNEELQKLKSDNEVKNADNNNR